MTGHVGQYIEIDGPRVWVPRNWDEVATGDRSCYVPAWAFELVER